MVNFWPIDIARCCPQTCHCLIKILPSTFRSIKDCTHLVLVIGLLIGIALIIYSLFIVFDPALGCFLRPTNCTHKLFDLVFLLPYTGILTGMLGYYDDRRQTLLRNLNSQKNLQTEAWQDALGDMNDLLGHAAKNAAGLAEKNFARHRRDFLTFLQRFTQRYNDSWSASEADKEQFRDQLRTLMRHWMRAFEETSIDPKVQPITIERDNDLVNYNDVGTLVVGVKEMVEKVQVQVLSADARANSDSAAIASLKDALQKYKQSQSALALASPISSDNLERGLQELRSVTASRGPNGSRCGWCKCAAAGCGISLTGGKHFPVKIEMLCLSMNILCREHLYMLVGIIVGLILASFHVLFPIFTGEDDEFDYTDLTRAVPIFIYTICLLVLVMDVERTSEILRMEREVNQLKEERQKVESVHNDMRVYWERVQNLTDRWLHRVIPLLDLYKELNDKVAETDPGKLFNEGILDTMNSRIADLQINMGTAEEWSFAFKCVGDSSTKSLNSGVKEVVRASRTESIEKLMESLESEIKDGRLSRQQLSSAGACLMGIPGEASSDSLPCHRGPSTANVDGGTLEMGSYEEGQSDKW